MSFIAQLISLLNGLFTLARNLFGGKAEAQARPAVTVKAANDMARASAEIARETHTETQKELTDAQDQTDAAVADVRSADSVSDIASTVQDAIRRANEQSGAND